MLMEKTKQQQQLTQALVERLDCSTKHPTTTITTTTTQQQVQEQLWNFTTHRPQSRAQILTMMMGGLN